MEYGKSLPVSDIQPAADLQARRSARRQIGHSARVRYDKVAHQLASPTTSPLQLTIDQQFEANRYGASDQRDKTQNYYQVNTVSSWSPSPRFQQSQVFETGYTNNYHHQPQQLHPILASSWTPSTFIPADNNNDISIFQAPLDMSAEQKIWSKRGKVLSMILILQNFFMCSCTFNWG